MGLDRDDTLIRRRLRQKMEFSGETELRGFEDPVKLWELRWKEQG